MHGRRWTREEGLANLDSADRRRLQDPQSFWREVGLRPRDIVADVGAGTGFFAIPAATLLAGSGTVYAIDISEELVELLRERKIEHVLDNLVPVHSKVDRIPLDSSVADIVLLANVLHDIPPATLAEAIRLLKPGGRLVNTDWKKVETPGGPPLHIRLNETEATERIVAGGLVRERVWNFGAHHYVIEFRKPGTPSTP